MGFRGISQNRDAQGAYRDMLLLLSRETGDNGCMSLAVGFRIFEAASNLKVKVYLPPGLEYISLSGRGFMLVSVWFRLWRLRVATQSVFRKGYKFSLGLLQVKFQQDKRKIPAPILNSEP